MKSKTTLILVPFAALALAGCAQTGTSSSEQSSAPADDYVYKTISPAGAPTLAYYDQGSNQSFVTDSVPTNVVGQFRTSTYDAIVFDSLNGLKQIKSFNYGFKLARFLTGGNFYVVSYGKSATDVPTATSTFASFSENGLPDLVFKKLLASYSGYSAWQMPSSVTYLAGVSDVMSALVAHTYDFYFIAQPALFAAKAKLGADASKVNVIANVRSDWKSYSGQTSIPQAALFVRNSSSTDHPSVLTSYLSALDQRLADAVDHPEKAKAAIEAYSADATVQSAKFGYSAAVAYNVQKDGANGFGIVKPDSLGVSNLSFVNSFVEKLGNSAYSAFDGSLFL